MGFYFGNRDPSGSDFTFSILSGSILSKGVFLASSVCVISGLSGSVNEGGNGVRHGYELIFPFQGGASMPRNAAKKIADEPMKGILIPKNRGLPREVRLNIS